MARFKYLGEPARPYVVTYGPTQKILTPLKNGTTQELVPISPATEFVIGVDIGYTITDPRSLRAFRADPRYQEI